MAVTPIHTKKGYRSPSAVRDVGLLQLLESLRPLPQSQQSRFAFASSREESPKDSPLYYVGELELLRRPCVALVGTRKVSKEGAARARRLARELVHAVVTVVSGLAEGVDTCAHTAAIEAGGRTIAVIGTSLDKAYPAKNGRLQECIYTDHLLVSPFAMGSRVFQSNFPRRNKIMAALCDATVIIEASDTSGTLHQARECIRLKRWLFMLKSLVESDVSWPERFLKPKNPDAACRVAVLTATDQILRIKSIATRLA